MIIGTIFSIMPAFVYWLAGTLAANGDPVGADGRRHRRLHHAPEPPVLPARPAAQRAGRDPGLAGPVRPDLRVPRDGPRDRRRARRRRARPDDVRGGVRFRDVSFRYPSAPVLPSQASETSRTAITTPRNWPRSPRSPRWKPSKRAPSSRSTPRAPVRDRPAVRARGHRVRGATRRAGRAGRSVRLGQDDDDVPDPAAVRRRRAAPSRSTASTSGGSSSRRSARSSGS